MWRELKNFLKKIRGFSTPFGGISWETKKANLSLVDLLIIDTDEFPKIEIKVRNNSDEVVFLKKGRIHHFRTLEPPISQAPRCSSC